MVSNMFRAKQWDERRTLPLEDHSLELVVEDKNLHADVVLRSRLKFHGGHAEGSITVDVDDSLFGGSDFRTDGCR